MAALDFPASPSVDQLYSANGGTWRWTGTVWVSGNTIVAPGASDDFIYLNADYTLTSTTAMQKLFDTTTNGRFDLPAGIYTFDSFIYMTGMSATSGNGEFSMLGAGTATIGTILMASVGRDGNNVTANTASTLSGSITNNTKFSSRTATAGAGTQLYFTASGVAKCTTAGTIVPSFELNDAAAAVVKAGSYFRIRRLADATTYSAGAWD